MTSTTVKPGSRRFPSAAVALVALAAIGAGQAAAQTNATTNARPPTVTNLGPTPAPGVIAAPGQDPATSLPPGTSISRPPYQSAIGLPYGQGVQPPYAYGATRPTTLSPTTPQAKRKPAPGAPAEGAAAGEQPGIAATGPATAAGVTPPVDPRLGLPRRMGSEPGVDQPPIKAAPDFQPGDPYARSAGSPSLIKPFGASPYRAPYSIDAAGNYFNPGGKFDPNGSVTPNATYSGRVDAQGRVFDKYGNQRGIIQK